MRDQDIFVLVVVDVVDVDVVDVDVVVVDVDWRDESFHF
jgi:hypothetical protein